MSFSEFKQSLCTKFTKLAIIELLQTAKEIDPDTTLKKVFAIKQKMDD